MSEGELNQLDGMSRLDLARHINDALDRLSCASGSALSRAEAAEVLSLNETASRKISAVVIADVGLIAEHHLCDGVDGVCEKAKGTRQFLQQHLTLSTKQAGQRVTRAGHLNTTISMTGEPLPPSSPDAAEALRHGKITVDHADVLIQMEKKIAHVLRETPGLWDVYQSAVTRYAVGQTPDPANPDLAPAAAQDAAETFTFARQMAEALDPDGKFTDELDRRHRRGLTIGLPDVAGMSRISGWLHPRTAELLRVITAKYGQPGFNDPFAADDTTLTGSREDYLNPADDAAAEADAQQGLGVSDPHQQAGQKILDAARDDGRTVMQRNHDALLFALERLVANGIGDHNGTAAIVVAYASIEQLVTLSGMATTAHGGVLPIADALDMAAGKGVIVLTDKTGYPLDIGRVRIASQWQRFALAIRDKHCIWPNCTAPPGHCTPHHVLDYAKGSMTNLPNLALLCDHHHKRIGDGAGQWHTTYDRATRTVLIAPNIPAPDHAAA